MHIIIVENLLAIKIVINKRIKDLTFKDSISANASPFWYSASANWSRVDSNFFLIFCSEIERSLYANKLQIATVGSDNGSYYSFGNNGNL